MRKILVVDDDISIAQLISDALEDEGFETVIKNDGKSAYDYIKEKHNDIALITLDIMMPDIDGIRLCQFIRNSVDCPIIFVSAKSEAGDAVYGLENGADDYISKPFVVDEFVARVKAHLRREKRANREADKNIIRVGEVEINTDTLEVFRSGRAVSFSTREFQLIQYLMENAGKVLTREQIFSHVWDSEFGDIGTVAVNIKNIRDKIDPENQYIKTVWGVGYKFVKNG
jgi:DNA-binding response OmpR family regulator